MIYLIGMTLVVCGDIHESVSQLGVRLSSITGVLWCHFYLAYQVGVLVDSSSLEQSGCGKDALMYMHSGLRKGQTSRCTWLLAPLFLHFAHPAGNRRQQRETQALGKAPKVLPRWNPRTDVRPQLVHPTSCVSQVVPPRLVRVVLIRKRCSRRCVVLGSLRIWLRSACSPRWPKRFLRAATTACSHRATKQRNIFSNFSSCRPSLMLGSRRTP